MRPDEAAGSISSSDRHSSDRGNDNTDSDGFFSGTFDNPGEPGFSGPSYAGQGSANMGSEIDRISRQFEQLDELYNTSYGGLFGSSVGARSATIVMDATGSMRGFDPRGERVGYEEAAFAARGMGLNQLASDIYGSRAQYPDGFVGSLQEGAAAIGAGIGSRFGTDPSSPYVVGMDEGYIGKITEDFSGQDLFGNLLGMMAPGGVRVDRALTEDITGRGMGTREFQYGESMFAESASLMTPEQAETQRVARAAQDEAERAGGDGGMTAQGIVDPAYAASVAAAGGRSSLLGSFLKNTGVNVVAPMVRPDLSNTVRFYGSRYFKEGGEVKKKAAGGSADNYDKQMFGALSERPRPVLDPVEVRKNPEAFMLDPVKARNAQELSEIYGYNQDIMDMSRKPLQAQEGMQVGEPGEQPSGDGPVGFVGSRKPETISEAETVADDVPLDVEEGTFVINAAAVEFSGSDDIKSMILDAIDEARKQGVDISGDENKIDREKAVSLLVSKGEVIVPPVLAKIIGYDRLNKINNRGKPEVEERVEENGQSPEAEALDEEPMQPDNPAEGMAMQEGGVTYVQGQGSVSDTGAQANISGEYRGDGFAVRPSVNYSEQSDTLEYPDGVVVDSTGKNLGFAVNGEMFLTDDTSLRAGIQRQTSTRKETVQLPSEMGGETLEFGGGQKMKRYNMGATFGDISADISKAQGSGQPISGRVQYRFSPDGEVFIEGTDDGRSGRIGLNYRF